MVSGSIGFPGSLKYFLVKFPQFLLLIDVVILAVGIKVTTNLLYYGELTEERPGGTVLTCPT